MSVPRTDIPQEQLTGFKYFKKFLSILDRLHDAATASDKPHNRILHFDQYVGLELIFLFNPIITSMRGLIQVSGLEKVREQLAIAPTSLGSFSEAGGVDTPHVPPFGTPEQVSAQVIERLRIFAPGGGYVFNTIHNIQARTPIANVVALVEAVRAFRY